MNTEVMFHCGNAPKMERVIELTIALAGRDENAAKVHLREDFVWTEVGAGKIADYSTLGDSLSRRQPVSIIKIDNGLSHGNGAMCEGVIEYTDNKSFYFCSVAQFVNTAKNALVKSLHVYVIEKTL